VSGQAEVGYSEFKARSAATRDHDGMTFDFRLSSMLSDSLLLSFDGRQDLQFSYSPIYPYYVDQRYRVTLTQHLGRRLDVSGATEQDRLHYGGRAASSPGDPGLDTLQDYTAGPGVYLHGIRLGVYAGYAHRRAASGVNQGYQGVHYGVVVTASRLTVGDKGIFLNSLSR
jgi:hypothetical protein